MEGWGNSAPGNRTAPCQSQRLKWGSAARSQRAPPALENPDPACGPACATGSWDTALFASDSPGHMGNGVGKARNLKPCLENDFSPCDPGSPDTRRWNPGWGCRVRGSRRTGWGKGEKALARASRARSNLQVLPRLMPAGIPSLPYLELWC